MATAATPEMEDLNGTSVDDISGAGGGGDESSFDEIEMAATGINMLLNNGFDEAFLLFEKYKNESTLMHSGYSFVYVMQAMLSFEEEKLGEAIKVLQDCEKRCSGNEGRVKSLKRKFRRKKRDSAKSLDLEARVTNQVIVADCILYQALLVFTNQDFSSYIKGGWLLRKAWKIYEKLHSEVTTLINNVACDKISKLSTDTIPKSSLSTTTPTQIPFHSTDNLSGPATVTPSSPNPEPPSPKKHGSPKSESGSSVMDGNDNELSEEVLSRLMGAVNFGYGAFQLCISMVPPKILKLIEFLGFEGDRQIGLSCLSYTSHSSDMKAPLATLALLWYHTFLRPFFALDGAARFQEGTTEAETIMSEKEKDFPNSSLFLFFRGRIHRLRKENEKALLQYSRALEEAKGQREVELMCLYEISWCHLLKLNWSGAQDGFARLQKESRWSQSYYTYLVGVCLGSRGELDAAHDMFKKVPGLVRRKNNPIESFVCKRAEKFKKEMPTVEHCRLLTLELMFLWNALPMCTSSQLQSIMSVCDMQSENRLFPLKCLLEGTIYKELGDEEMALNCLKEGLARHQGKKEDMFIPAYTLFEISSIKMRSPQTINEAKISLTMIKDNYKDYDLENRLSVRVNNALRLIKAVTSPAKKPANSPSKKS